MRRLPSWALARFCLSSPRVCESFTAFLGSVPSPSWSSRCCQVDHMHTTCTFTTCTLTACTLLPVPYYMYLSRPDMLKFLVVFTPILVSFSMAFYLLFNSSGNCNCNCSCNCSCNCNLFNSSGEQAYGGDMCAPFVVDQSLGGVLSIAMTLFEAMLGGNNLLDCFHNSRHSVAAPLLMTVLAAQYLSI